jgi:tryptophan 2,3-dioxygenase
VSVLHALFIIGFGENGQGAHDEHLFITIHQTYELWFKQMMFEIDDVIRIFKQDVIPESNIGIACRRLKRVTEIQRVLLDQLVVLETMTPLGFLEFRDYLFPASGFQSLQFRMIEKKLGLQERKRIKYAGRHYCVSARVDISLIHPSPSYADHLLLYVCSPCFSPNNNNRLIYQLNIQIY